MTYDLIIFDYDGVVADSEVLNSTVMAEQLTAIGLPTSLDDVLAAYTGKRWRDNRPVVEAAGIRDLLSKRYGSNNPINVVKATFLALSALTSLAAQARSRGMTPHELNQRRMRREPAAQEAQS